MNSVMGDAAIAIALLIYVAPALAEDLPLNPAVRQATIGDTIWTVLKTWPSLSISDSIRVGGREMIRCASSLVFLISMIG